MTRRKREIVGLANEQDFPHLVEFALPLGGFRSVFPEIDRFHRDRRIPVRRGRSRHEAEQFYIRFCFPDAATADAFRNRFGGECLTHAPGKPKPRTWATSSDASASKREAEEAWGKRNGDRALLTPPALGEGCHRSLARRLVAVDRRAVFVVTVGERPEPWRAHGRGGSFHDAADDLALTQHVVVVLAPLAGQAGSRRAFEDQCIHLLR